MTLAALAGIFRLSATCRCKVTDTNGAFAIGKYGWFFHGDHDNLRIRTEMTTKECRESTFSE